jgi:hypothetical protein
MIDIFDRPLILFAILAVVLIVVARLGARLSRRYPVDQDMRQDFNILLGAVLTLLALMIGFSFSLASGRYDQRKNLEEAEANAIGTEYTRADLLPATDGAKVRLLLRSYIEQRIQFYEAGSEAALAPINAHTAQLQSEMWAAVLPAAAALPTPITALAVSGMNDVLNSQGFSQAAWWNRIPSSAWGLILVIAVCANFLGGYGAHSIVAAKRLLFIFPLFIAVTLGFIADIDSPRHGVIRVQPQNLISLQGSLPAS